MQEHRNHYEMRRNKEEYEMLEFVGNKRCIKAKAKLQTKPAFFQVLS